MANKIETPIGYGHLGGLYYNVRTSKWIFERRIGSTSLRQLTQSDDILPTSLFQTEESDSEDEESHLWNGKYKPRTQVDELLKRFPELVSAKSDLLRCVRQQRTILKEHQSGAANTLMTIYNDSSSNLFSPSNELSEDYSYFIAIASENRKHKGRFSLVRMTGRRDGWNSSHTAIQLRNLKLEVGTGFDYAVDGPILQLTASHRSRGSGQYFLLVRQHKKTRVCLPLWTANGKVSSLAKADLRSLQSFVSGVHIEQAIEIPHQNGSGQGHISCAFHPWGRQMVVVLDRFGRWEIWQFRSHMNQPTKLEEPLFHVGGQLSDWTRVGYPDPSPETHIWGQVLWLASNDRQGIIVFANRSRLWLMNWFYNAPGPEYLDLPEQLQFANQTILAIDSTLFESNHLFVLTTTQVVWIKFWRNLKSIGEVRTLSHQRTYPTKSIWPLRLSVQRTSRTIFLFVYSTVDSLILGYECLDSHDDRKRARFLRVKDTFTLLPQRGPGEMIKYTDIAYGVDEIKVIPLRVCESYSGPRTSTMRAEVKFAEVFQIIVSFKGLGIKTAFYGTQSFVRKAHEPLEIDTQRFRIQKFSNPIKQKRYSTQLKDFVVSDDEEDNEIYPRSFQRKRDPLSSDMQAARRRAMSLDGRQSDALRKVLEGSIQKFSYETPFMQRVQSSVTSVLSSETNIWETAIDLFEGTTHMIDVELVSKVLAMSFKKIEVRDDISIRKMIGPYLDVINLPVVTTTPMSYSDFHESIRSIWNRSLPDSLPSDIAADYDRKIKRVALSVYLASIGLWKPARAPEEAEDNTHAFPATQPNMLQTSTQFSTQFSTQGSNIGQGPNEADPQTSAVGQAVTRLRNFTTVHDQPKPGKYLSSILDHWVTGADPTTYSWERTNARLKREHELRELAKEDDKTRKKRLRAERKQRSQMLAEHNWGAEPPSQPFMLQSSQMETQESQIPMTQVERGPFGGRDVKPKKKAKKTKGFR